MNMIPTDSDPSLQSNPIHRVHREILRDKANEWTFNEGSHCLLIADDIAPMSMDVNPWNLDLDKNGNVNKSKYTCGVALDVMNNHITPTFAIAFAKVIDR